MQPKSRFIAQKPCDGKPYLALLGMTISLLWDIAESGHQKKKRKGFLQGLKPRPPKEKCRKPLRQLKARRCVEIARGLRADRLVEISGGITLQNARAYAQTGADFLSSGALTHSAPAADVSLLVDWVQGK